MSMDTSCVSSSSAKEGRLLRHHFRFEYNNFVRVLICAVGGDLIQGITQS